MIVKTNYSRCRRLYWEPEDLEKEAPEATFSYRGGLHHLEFDGLVDDLVRDNLRSKSPLAVNIADLFQAIPVLEESVSALENGERIEIFLPLGRPWKAIQRLTPHGICYILRSAFGQSATFTKSAQGVFKRLILRTEAKGMTHEVKAEPGGKSGWKPTAEAVTVYED